MRTCLVPGLVMLALLLPAAGRVSAEYLVTELGGLGGYESFATGINNAGQVVGYAYVGPSSDARAFLYSGGKMSILGTLGGSLSYASGINDSGQVVGYSTLKGLGAADAFLYSGGKMADLGSFGGGSMANGATTSPGSGANGVNGSGQVVGVVNIPGTFFRHAFLYSGGKMTDLGALPGYNNSLATAINASGQVVGWSSKDITSGHAFLYSGGKMTDLGTLGGADSYANGINASGQVVGYSSTLSANRHAFLYAGGKMTDLGTLAGGESLANGINASGQVVGYSYVNGMGVKDAYGFPIVQHAFLYANGKMTDLNSLIAADSGWVLETAKAINDKGQILAYGLKSGGLPEDLLLTPVDAPEPGSLALLGLGAVCLAGYRCRRRGPAPGGAAVPVP